MDTATWFNNKLTSLIYDGDRAVDWTQAKTMEGSSATNMTRWLEGDRRRTIGEEAWHEIHLEIEGAGEKKKKKKLKVR